jgi:energy-coupling factor transporter ATP-binding protein EcfA2
MSLAEVFDLLVLPSPLLLMNSEMKLDQFLKALEQFLNAPRDNWWLLVTALTIYVLMEVVLGVTKRTPLWILRQFLGSIRRFFWGELRYLHALINDDRLKQWAHQYVILRAIKASTDKERAKPEPLINLLQSYIRQNRQVIVIGDPGAGKTTSLEALAYLMARQAFWKRVVVWIIYGSLISLLAIFLSPWWLLLLCSISAFDFIFKRWPLPMLIELRWYESGAIDDFLKETVAQRVGGKVVSEVLRNYVEHGSLAWLLDGINEMQGGAYESAVEGWRELFKPSHYFAHAPVIFTSRTGDNPAKRLDVNEVLDVLDLDDEAVRIFLRVYGSQDVEADFAALYQNNMLGERGLGRNPYWLKMKVEGGKYIRNRGALFENFARQLIQRELDKAPVRPQPSVVPVDDELEALGYLAYVMSDKLQVGLALTESEANLARWLKHRHLDWKPMQVLNEAEAATLIRVYRRENRVEYSHQLLQEFFAAYAQRFIDHRKEAIGHADDYNWWRTLLMLGGLLEEHTIEVGKVGNHQDYCDLVRGMLSGGMSERVILGVGLLRSVDEMDQTLQHEVAMALRNSLIRGVTPEHRQGVAELAHIMSDDVVELFEDLLISENEQALREGIVELLAEIDSKKAMDTLINLFKDDSISTHVHRAIMSKGEKAVRPLIAILHR